MTRRALVVVLDEGLHPSRVTGIFHNVRLLPGVYCVADLASIDRVTLDRVLLTLDPEPEKPPRRRWRSTVA